MDIFDYAAKFNADYYDQRTGYIYKVADYNQRKKLGLPAIGIQVIDWHGNEIGWCYEEDRD